jgi:hypothetical protein
MTRTPSPFLRSLLALALVSPGLSAVEAAAQVVTAPAGVSGSASAAAAAGAASRAIVMPSMTVPSLAPALGAMSAPSISPSFAAPVAAAAVPLAAPAALAAAPRQAAGDGPTPLQEPLKPGQRWSPSPNGGGRVEAGEEMIHDGPRGRELVSIRSLEAPEVPEGWESARSRSARTFDGAARRRDLSDDSAPVAAPSAASAAAPLAPSASAAAPAPAAVPLASSRVKSARGLPLALKVMVVLALALMPGLAFAAPVVAATAGPIAATAAGSLSLLASIQPLASAAGAVAGAVYGMFASRPKDGSEASSGEMVASVLRYGALGGASVYMLFDLTNMAFVGPTVAGLQPLSAAVVTAALGRTAFQGKFSDPATSSADRIVGAFPAVAAALGISLGVMSLAVAPLSVTLAVGAMAVTGVATALFSSLFKLGRSPLDGPALMAKGYVLQALMTGLALAVTSPYQFWIFAAMGTAGFGLVLWAMGRELLSFLPGRATPAPTPTTPPAPPTTPPGPKA